VALADAVRDSGARFAVTGATGWLGRAAAEVLARALGPELAAARLSLFASRPRDVALDAGVTLPAAPLSALPEAEFDVLLHYAFLTRDRVDDVGLDAYIHTNLEITATVLEAIARARPRAVAYASSGAVYAVGGGDDDDDGRRRLATDLASNPYGSLKHLDELALRRAAEDAGARSLVLRVFNVAGPWLTRPRAFALSDFVLQAQEGDGPLRVSADRPVLRSYVDVEDLGALAVAWALADEGDRDVVLDTAGDETIEIGALAARVAGVVGVRDRGVARTWDPDAAPSAYVGDGTALHALAARLGVPLRGLDDQIARTARALGAAPGT
jgi:UDP-glucuronate decarboxylase